MLRRRRGSPIGVAAKYRKWNGVLPDSARLVVTEWTHTVLLAGLFPSRLAYSHGVAAQRLGFFLKPRRIRSASQRVLLWAFSLLLGRTHARAYTSVRIGRALQMNFLYRYVCLHKTFTSVKSTDGDLSRESHQKSDESPMVWDVHETSVKVVLFMFRKRRS